MPSHPGKRHGSSHTTEVGDAKIHTVLGEFKRKRLKSGRGGPVVTNPKQALAIAMSESRKARRLKDGT